MSSESHRQRRTFTEEFKRDAVNLVVEEAYTIAATVKAVNVLPGEAFQKINGEKAGKK